MTLIEELQRKFPGQRLKSRYIDRIAHASDGSFYRLVPRAVVFPNSVAEIQALFEISRARRVPMTFRSAGTSLSGQAVTNGILADTARYWKKMRIEKDGTRVRVQPGVIAGHINQRLDAFQRRIGPDPSSIASATIGGIIANNSGGRSVMLESNSYHCLESISFVLPNGFYIDSESRSADDQFEQACPRVAEGLLGLKKKIEADYELTEKIRRKYRMRNTMGYSLNAFLDFEKPLDILAHLLVGSEGTLGFVSEAVLRTIPIYPFRLTGLLFFENLKTFGAAIQPLAETTPQELEFMDRQALRNVQDLPGMLSLVRELPDSAVAVLAEYHCPDEQALSVVRNSTAELVNRLSLLEGSLFTEDPRLREAFWKVRTRVVPATFARHPRGTIAQIEDVVVPVARVGAFMEDLHRLFKRHPGCEEMVIFGHLTFGNVHFIINPGFNSPDEIRHYDLFMQDVVDLVVKKYEGALKGEHATGRNMAPYLEAEWGREACRIMAEVKALIDPDNLLNPGVIINPDPKANLRDLKPLPRIHPEVDLCIECGHCEWVCPSLNLTLSPRQRIVVRREIKRLQESGRDDRRLKVLVRDYQYAGIDTCAADGMCAVACPIDIDTGALTRRLRAEAVSSKGQAAAVFSSRHGAGLEGVLRASIKMGALAARGLGQRTLNRIIGLAETISGAALPKWDAAIRRPYTGHLPPTRRQGAAIVYFPSCMTRIMGTSPTPDKPALIHTFLTVAERAGIPVWLPEDCHGICCGMPFHSKGYTSAYRETLCRTLNKFWDWSREGRLPIFIDSTSCAYALRSCEAALGGDDRRRWAQMTILDPIEFIHDRLLPNLNVNRLNRSVVLHPNCAAVKLGLEEKLSRIGRQCAKSSTIPLPHNCCGFAGDRGLLFPELTKSATRAQAEEIERQGYDGYFSTNLPCEMGLSRATGKAFDSAIYLVEAATR